MNKGIVSINKLRFQRGYSYLNIVGITFLVARELSKYAIQIGWNINWIILWLCGIFTVWFVGYSDIKFGFWGKELEIGFTRNPEWMMAKEKIMEEKRKQAGELE